MPWAPKPLKRPLPSRIDLRGTACKRGYDRKWRKAREAYLAEHPFCEHCLEESRHEAAEMVDHIVPLSMNGERLSEANFQALCHSCHAKKTAAEG